jgi:ADP-heptose:LPS heptosyltransferase/glycosyltransferase involved in cell wall biosynthesis
MRILASNPDTIGDMVLRQPFYDALLRAGHQLMLVVRPSVEPLVKFVAPESQVVTLPFEVYRDDLPAHWDEFRDVFQAAQDFKPDALVVAPYRWTLFDERLAAMLPGVRRYGMSGRLYAGDPHAGRAPDSTLHFDVVASVEEDQAEVEKYRALASSILGQPLPPVDPVLRADELSLDRARQTLNRLGLSPGEYWIAAVAGTIHVPLKQWRPEAWGEVLSRWSAQYGRRFLFVGVADELPLIETVRQAMNGAVEKSPVWAEPKGDLEQLLALVSLSAGYVGHDTGPMHMAAAAGKPVLAVFGGGTWPRFVPAVTPSCALTVGVACAGCGWSCAFDCAHCISEVPSEEVNKAVDELETGKMAVRDLRVIPASEQLLQRMVEESAARVRVQQRQSGDLARLLQTTNDQLHAAGQRQAALADQARQLQEFHDSHVSQIDTLRQDFEDRAAEIDSRHAAEVTRLTETIEQLAARVTALEPKPRIKKPREPWKIRAAKWIAGKNYYYPLLGVRPLPKISIVTPVKNGQQFIRQTIESVLGQDYPKLEYIIVDGGSTDDTLKIIDEYRDRIDRVISEPDQGMYDAIGKGFDAATGDVLGYLNADDLFEPGGLLRVGEYFRDHRRAKVIYHEDTVTMDGWRFPNIAQPHVDVYPLLAGHTLFQDGIFFRKSAYTMAGGINPELKRAGDWDLWVRLARMWGLSRATGHVSSFRIRKGQISEDRVAYDAELQQARTKFLGRFGLAGRLRCRVMQAANSIRNIAERFAHRRKMFWPIDYCGKPYPPGEAPPLIPDKPVSPLTGRAPDRLLFSTRDTRFGDDRINYVYYESKTGVAMAYPPLTQSQLTELYEKHYSNPIKEVIEPDPDYHSPYKNFRGGNIVARNLYRLPSPWWWFQKITYHDDAAAEIIRATRGLISPQDQDVRFLDVGCFEGGLLDRLKTLTGWQLSGLEANANAVKVAREKGHPIWESTAEDAALIVPETTSFDLIFLGQTMEHLDDPLAAINRLKPLLAPGGAFVISVPNLNSKQVELFGPTWAHWHMPYHRTLLTPRALRRLAKLAGLRVERLRTRTHPYWTTMSVQLNRLGLGAVVPHTAYFSNVMAMHGTRLTGWCRLLWDWQGRGDYMVAILRSR